MKRPTTRRSPAASTFSFSERWKEELVCRGPGGTFSLQLDMGGSRYVVHLPAEAVWRSRAPAWAHELWPTLEVELQAWCATVKAKLVIGEDAIVYYERT